MEQTHLGPGAPSAIEPLVCPRRKKRAAAAPRPGAWVSPPRCENGGTANLQRAPWVGKMAGIPHTLSGLMEKREAVARLARELEDRLAQARSDVLHLDAVIRMFDPASQPEPISGKDFGRRNGWFSDGELPRRALDALRTAPRPPTR